MAISRAVSAMLPLALLVAPGATPSSVSATLDLLRIAARIDPTRTPRLDIFSPSGGAIALAPGLSLTTAPLPARLEGYAAVLMPGFFAADTPELVAHLQGVWHPAVECLRALPEETLVAASCYGVFVLAQSGLLDGHKVTTTWWMGEVLAARYPALRVDVGRVVVDDGRVLTAGAMSAHTELTLHLLRRLCGHTLARRVGAVMLVDEARVSQRPYMQLPRHFDEPLVDACVAWLEGHLADPLGSTALAAALHVSYRTLHRRFRAATGLPPLAYLHALRVERAKQLLECGGQSIAQIAAEVGFADASSLRRAFTRHCDLGPGEYRRRFRAPG